MRKFLSILIISASFFSCAAQEKTLSPKDSLIKSSLGGQILVLPFSPKNYMCGIDYQIAAENKLNYQQIKEKIYQGVHKEVSRALNEKHQAFNLLDEKNPGLKQDLDYFYFSVSYPLKDLPESKSSGKKGKKSKNASQTKAQYTSAQFASSDFLEYLPPKYDASMLVIINRMEILAFREGDGGKDEYDRTLKLHYTVLDPLGREISGGIARTYFSAKKNELEKIIHEDFYRLGVNLRKDLFGGAELSD